MVPRESIGAKDLSYFFDDRMETPRGTFQRFTPSMVTKKLSQYATQQDLYRFRLASLTPLNPENRPDHFEKDSLVKFNSEGWTEAFKFDIHGKNHNLHYMVPLYLEKACLECHHAKEVSQNGIRGGLSIILPVNEMQIAVKKQPHEIGCFRRGSDLSRYDHPIFFDASYGDYTVKRHRKDDR